MEFVGIKKQEEKFWTPPWQVGAHKLWILALRSFLFGYGSKWPLCRTSAAMELKCDKAHTRALWDVRSSRISKCHAATQADTNLLENMLLPSSGSMLVGWQCGQVVYALWKEGHTDQQERGTGDREYHSCWPRPGHISSLHPLNLRSHLPCNMPIQVTASSYHLLQTLIWRQNGPTA
jgi:hypothetical protein